MDMKKLLGKKIQEIRKSKHITQEELSEIIGIEHKSISNIESGRHAPSIERLIQIAKVLDTKPDEFLKFEHLQENIILEEEIIKILKNNPDKLSQIYKVIKALTE